MFKKSGIEEVKNVYDEEFRENKRFIYVIII
jgi:hypothetical protein